jgi:quercetin dioxygenase-like cupin family protein
MMTRRALMGTAALLLAQAVRAENPANANKTVFHHELPEVMLKNWSVTAVEVSYAPGEASRAHSHPGITIGYVLEGEIRSKIGDEPEQTFSVGQMFIETPGQLHAVSANASATRPAKLLALLLAENGKPLTTLA